MESTPKRGRGPGRTTPVDRFLLFDDIDPQAAECATAGRACNWLSDPAKRALFEADRERWQRMPVPTGLSPEKSHSLPRTDAAQPASPKPAAHSSWVDLTHVSQFVEDECEQSPCGARMNALYEAYCSWAIAHHHDLAEIGPFIWWLRKTGGFDSCGLGHALGGGWVIGLGIRQVPGAEQAA